MLDASKHGHFLLVRDAARARQQVREIFTSIIRQGINCDNGLRAYVMVFEHQQKRVGFVTMSEINSSHGGNEIYTFLIDKQFRGRGYGQIMMSEIIKRIQPYADIYARCFDTSTTMIRLLLKNGFRMIGRNQDNVMVFCLEKLAYAM